jgi:hypothetical protein
MATTAVSVDDLTQSLLAATQAPATTPPAPPPEGPGQPRSTPRHPLSDPQSQEFRDLAQQYQLDPALMGKMMQAESNFDPRAESKAGAQGLMQLMKGTQKQYGVTDPFDPGQNVPAGFRHYRKLLDQYEGNHARALAAYNAGEGAVQQYGGVPPYAETHGYIRKILGQEALDSAAADTISTSLLRAVGAPTTETPRRQWGSVRAAPPRPDVTVAPTPPAVPGAAAPGTAPTPPTAPSAGAPETGAPPQEQPTAARWPTPLQRRYVPGEPLEAPYVPPQPPPPQTIPPDAIDIPEMPPWALKVPQSRLEDSLVYDFTLGLQQGFEGYARQVGGLANVWKQMVSLGGRSTATDKDIAGGLEQAATQAAEAVRVNPDLLKDRTRFDQVLAQAIGSAIPGVAEFVGLRMLGVPGIVAGVAPAVAAHVQEGLLPAAWAGLKALVMYKAQTALTRLPPAAQIPAAGAIGGGAAYLETGDPQRALADAFVAAGIQTTLAAPQLAPAFQRFTDFLNARWPQPPGTPGTPGPRQPIPSQQVLTDALTGFRNGKTPADVATDLARTHGLDADAANGAARLAHDLFTQGTTPPGTPTNAPPGPRQPRLPTPEVPGETPTTPPGTPMDPDRVTVGYFADPQVPTADKLFMMDQILARRAGRASEETVEGTVGYFRDPRIPDAEKQQALARILAERAGGQPAAPGAPPTEGVSPAAPATSLRTQMEAEVSARLPQASAVQHRRITDAVMQARSLNLVEEIMGGHGAGASPDEIATRLHTQQRVGPLDATETRDMVHGVLDFQGATPPPVSPGEPHTPETSTPRTSAPEERTPEGAAATTPGVPAGDMTTHAQYGRAVELLRSDPTMDAVVLQRQLGVTAREAQALYDAARQEIAQAAPTSQGAQPRPLSGLPAWAPQLSAALRDELGLTPAQRAALIPRIYAQQPASLEEAVQIALRELETPTTRTTGRAAPAAGEETAPPQGPAWVGDLDSALQNLGYKTAAERQQAIQRAVDAGAQSFDEAIRIALRPAGEPVEPVTPVTPISLGTPAPHSPETDMAGTSAPQTTTATRVTEPPTPEGPLVPSTPREPSAPGMTPEQRTLPYQRPTPATPVTPITPDVSTEARPPVSPEQPAAAARQTPSPTLAGEGEWPPGDQPQGKWDNLPFSVYALREDMRIWERHWRGELQRDEEQMGPVKALRAARAFEERLPGLLTQYGETTDPHIRQTLTDLQAAFDRITQVLMSDPRQPGYVREGHLTQPVKGAAPEPVTPSTGRPPTPIEEVYGAQGTQTTATPLAPRMDALVTFQSLAQRFKVPPDAILDAVRPYHAGTTKGGREAARAAVQALGILETEAPQVVDLAYRVLTREAEGGEGGATSVKPPEPPTPIAPVATTFPSTPDAKPPRSGRTGGFASEENAKASLRWRKDGVTADTHEVRQTGPRQWEIVPKGSAAPEWKPPAAAKAAKPPTFRRGERVRFADTEGQDWGGLVAGAARTRQTVFVRVDMRASPTGDMVGLEQPVRRAVSAWDLERVPVTPEERQPQTVPGTPPTPTPE